jgi:hypothetical protein
MIDFRLYLQNMAWNNTIRNINRAQIKYVTSEYNQIYWIIEIDNYDYPVWVKKIQSTQALIIEASKKYFDIPHLSSHGVRVDGPSAGYSISGGLYQIFPLPEVDRQICPLIKLNNLDIELTDTVKLAISRIKLFCYLFGLKYTQGNIYMTKSEDGWFPIYPNTGRLDFTDQTGSDSKQIFNLIFANSIKFELALRDLHKDIVDIDPDWVWIIDMVRSRSINLM